MSGDFVGTLQTAITAETQGAQGGLCRTLPLRTRTDFRVAIAKPQVNGENERRAGWSRPDAPSHLRPLSQEGDTAMIPHPPESGNTPTDDIRDAAWNALAVASIHWQQSVNALRHILVSASDYGLTMDELVVATGIQRANILRILADGRDL